MCFHVQFFFVPASSEKESGGGQQQRIQRAGRPNLDKLNLEKAKSDQDIDKIFSEMLMPPPVSAIFTPKPQHEGNKARSAPKYSFPTVHVSPPPSPIKPLKASPEVCKFLTASLRMRSYKLISWSWWRNFQTWKILKIWWYLENLENGKFEKKFEETMKKKIWKRKFEKGNSKKRKIKKKFEKGNLKKEIWKRSHIFVYT